MKNFFNGLSILLLLALLLTLAPTAVLAQEEVVCESDVVVQADDWLSKIADKFYGDALAYPVIAEATNAKAAADASYATIANVDVIEIGWKLCLPSAADAQAMLGETAAATPMTEGEMVLTVWDVNVRDVESQMMETLNAEFEAAHPGVKINRVPKSFDDMMATVQLGMSSPDGPDIAQVNQGHTDMGALVKANLLVNLMPYAQKYGWLSKLGPGLAARNSFSADGQSFGTGNLYGMPLNAELVGVYYNKAMFEQAGVSVPKTFVEFEAALATFKEAGMTPLALGNLEGWPAFHVHGEILNALLDSRQWVDNFVFGRGNVSVNTPENLAAAAKVQEWAANGYFTPGFAGVGYDDSWQLFANGEAAMMITGSWLSGEVEALPNPDNFGFFLVPPQTAGGWKMAIGGTTLAFAIRNGSANPDLAAEYIDWLASDRAKELQVEVGFLPVSPLDPAQLDKGPFFKDVAAAWATVNRTDAVGHYLDWATPTYFDTYSAALQELLASRITPEEFIQKLEADYSAYLAEKGG